MIVKILYSLFVLVLNFLIYQGISKGNIKKKQIIVLISFGLLIAFLNYKLSSLPNELMLFLLIFSISVIVLNFFKKNSTVFQRSNLLDNNKVEKFKFVMVTIILPIMITIYQFLIIWSDKLFYKMMNR